MPDDTPNFMLPVVGFQAEKAAQIAAYFATLAGDYGIEKLKLIKLIYLAERLFLKEHGFPMLFDELYSLRNGPVCSNTLNGIDGKVQNDVWAPRISRNGNLIFPVRRVTRPDLDEVSDAEMAALDAVWEEFRAYTASGIRNWTHKHLPEYVEVEEGRLPIDYSDLFKEFGFNTAEAADAAAEIRAFRRAEGLLSV